MGSFRDRISIRQKTHRGKNAKKNVQRDLAKNVGTSQAAISRIESMNGNPSLSLLKRIAKALEVKLVISLVK